MRTIKISKEQGKFIIRFYELNEIKWEIVSYVMLLRAEMVDNWIDRAEHPNYHYA